MRLLITLLIIFHFASCNTSIQTKVKTNMEVPPKEKEILDILDNSAKDGSVGFVSLSHPYSYLIDTRMNVFKGTNDRWAIAIERLGYNPRAGAVLLQIYYYGNCLKNLKVEVNKQCGINTFSPIDEVNFLSTTTEEESLKPESDTWIVRGEKVNIKYSNKEYIENGIEIDREDNSIGIEAAARYVSSKYPNLFRATDNELYTSIPIDLHKVLVLNEWYHKDYYLLPMEDMVPDYKKQNQKTWLEDRPSSYETWRQIAKVIATGDTIFYKPTLKANTHWKNWPESGSL